MQIIEATELVKLAGNSDRQVWVEKAVKAVMDGLNIKRDEKTYINLQNAIADTDIDELVEDMMTDRNVEWCKIDIKDRIEETLFNWLEELANDYDIGE